MVHVEHDHFVALVRADENGVSHLCTHCGPWPGGRVDLTWRQWDAMDPGECLAIARRGSPADRLLDGVLARRGRHDGAVQLAAAGSLARLHLGGAPRMASLIAILKSHVMLFPAAGSPGTCGVKRSTTRQIPGFPKALDRGCAGGAGPPGADPVNLATGEEEYSPEPDLLVYNPTGPPVVWGRIYDSLRGPDPDYQSDDYGIGWSQPYNVFLKVALNATAQLYGGTLICADGATLPFTLPMGTTQPPTSGNPINCVTGKNPPFRIDWRWDGSTNGYYTVTFTDGTRWVL